MKIILQLITVAMVAVGCSKSDIEPDKLVEIQYHLSGISESATVGVKEPAGEGLTVGVALSNKEGVVYKHSVPANFQLYAEYRTKEELKDDFRFWATHKGKTIFSKTKSDVIIDKGDNVVALSGIISSKI